MTDSPDPSGQPPARVHAAVVSLARAADRRVLMQAEMSKAGIGASFFDAVDGRAPENAARLAAMADRGPWGVVEMHAKACTSSHLDLLAEFLETGAEYCLVLEDDAFLSPELADWIADMSWWPAEAEIVKIERWRDDKLYVALGANPKTHLGREIAPLLSRHSGTAGYIVSRAGAAKVVAAEPVNMPIDHLLFNVNISPLARSLNCWQIEPALVVQGNEPPHSGGSAPVPPTVTESRIAKELRRGWHEAKVVPRLLALAATGKVKIRKISYAPSTKRGSDGDNGPTPAGTSAPLSATH